MADYPPPADKIKDETNDTKDADDSDSVDLHDITDVTLGPDGGGAHSMVATKSASEVSARQRRTKKLLIYAAIATVVLCIIIGIAVGVSGGGSSSSGSTVGVTLPKPQVEESTLERNRKTLTQILIPRYTARGMDMAPVSEPDTFQNRALDYVAGSELFEELTADQNVERYAVVVFYLSTFRQPHLLNQNLQPWQRNRNWLANTEICLWEGIECNANEAVVGIVLPENRMSGTLPFELSLLDSLSKLDLTSNLIYMDENNHGLWSMLPGLRELLMDDNFVISETGIPEEFADLSSIEKISLSFNLLQGSFKEGVFGSMESLMHFEAESNYISGGLPDDMLKLPRLTYIYMRRNSLELTLADILVPGNLPSLFALWLDGNSITGNIPASIGGFTSLASLSITGTQLAGPIPPEMAQLTDLQRLWLYENQLTGEIPVNVANAWSNIEVLEVYGNDLVGTMPPSICAAVAASDYELAILSADCGEIDCQDCCTECY